MTVDRREFLKVATAGAIAVKRGHRERLQVSHVRRSTPDTYPYPLVNFS